MRVSAALFLLLVPIPTLVSCTAEDDVTAADLALQAEGSIAPTLPRELVSGIRLDGTAADGDRLDLILLPAADRAVLIEELAPPVCAIEAAKALVTAGGTLRFMVGSREIGIVTICPET
jgi:hypothetical protein